MKGRGECKPSGSFDCDAQKTRVSAQDDAFGWLEGAAWDALAAQNDEQKQKQIPFGDDKQERQLQLQQQIRSK
jgi:hypothetical protein